MSFASKLNSNNTTHVIARYNEDVSWVKQIKFKFIVQKNIHLPNSGREASSYLWYIINYYHKLKDFHGYQFCQGRCKDHKISVFDHYCDLEGRPHHPGLEINNFAKRIGLKIPNILSFTAGAQFVTTAENIKWRHLDWYRELYEVSMSNEFPAPAHILERLWKYIFYL